MLTIISGIRIVKFDAEAAGLGIVDTFEHCLDRAVEAQMKASIITTYIPVRKHDRRIDAALSRSHQ
jgi:hypothetical protein